MKTQRPHGLASEDEARDNEILRRHGSHADDGDDAPRERIALARTKLRDAEDGERGEHGTARHARRTPRR